MLDDDALFYSVLHSAVSMLRIAWIRFDRFGVFYSLYFKRELKKKKNRCGFGIK